MSDRAYYAIFASGIVTAVVLGLIPRARKFDVGLTIFGVLWMMSMVFQRW